MADEQTQTPPDTTTSPSEAAPVVETPELVAAEPVVETPAEPAADTSVLGGEEAKAPEGEKPAEEPKPVEGAPEKYELTPPEGMQLDPVLMAEAEPVLRELNLTNEQANTILPLARKLQENTVQQIVELGAQQKKDWHDAFVADPEIGGPKREETVHLAARGMDALGFPEGHSFREALTSSGFGNHPDMIRAFRRIGEMVGEDGFVRSDGASKVDTPTETRWYKGA